MSGTSRKGMLSDVETLDWCIFHPLVTANLLPNLIAPPHAAKLLHCGVNTAEETWTATGGRQLATPPKCCHVLWFLLPDLLYLHRSAEHPMLALSLSVCDRCCDMTLAPTYFLSSFQRQQTKVSYHSGDHWQTDWVQALDILTIYGTKAAPAAGITGRAWWVTSSSPIQHSLNCCVPPFFQGAPLVLALALVKARYSCKEAPALRPLAAAPEASA